MVGWELPPELSEGVRVEVNVSGEWEEVGTVTHTIPHTSPEGDNFILYLRVSVNSQL